MNAEGIKETVAQQHVIKLRWVCKHIGVCMNVYVC